MTSSNKFGTKTAAALALLHFNETFVEIDMIRHMDHNLRASWHGMPTNNPIFAESDKWYVNLGQTPRLSSWKKTQQTVTRLWQLRDSLKIDK
jgi:hypothetical protein